MSRAKQPQIQNLQFF